MQDDASRFFLSTRHWHTRTKLAISWIVTATWNMLCGCSHVKVKPLHTNAAGLFHGLETPAEFIAGIHR